MGQITEKVEQKLSLCEKIIGKRQRQTGKVECLKFKQWDNK